MGSFYYVSVNCLQSRVPDDRRLVLLMAGRLPSPQEAGTAPGTGRLYALGGGGPGGVNPARFLFTPARSSPRPGWGVFGASDARGVTEERNGANKPLTALPGGVGVIDPATRWLSAASPPADRPPSESLKDWVPGGSASSPEGGGITGKANCDLTRRDGSQKIETSPLDATVSWGVRSHLTRIYAEG